MLKHPPAWAMNVSIYKYIERAGVKRIEIRDKDTGIVYTCSMRTSKRFAFQFDRNHSKQLGLVLEAWTTKDPKQKTLLNLKE